VKIYNVFSCIFSWIVYSPEVYVVVNGTLKGKCFLLHKQYKCESGFLPSFFMAEYARTSLQHKGVLTFPFALLRALVHRSDFSCC
jgi:hypothetical protein